MSIKDFVKFMKEDRNEDITEEEAARLFEKLLSKQVEENQGIHNDNGMCKMAFSEFIFSKDNNSIIDKSKV